MQLTTARDPRLRRALAILAGAAISAACGIAFVSQANLDTVSDRLTHANTLWLGGALGLMTANILLGVVRWRYLIGAAGHQVELPALTPAVLAARGANDVLPFRVGELVRLAVARHRLGIPAWVTAGTLVLERLLDAAILALILLAGAAMVGGPPVAFGVGTTLLALTMAGWVVLIRLSRARGDAPTPTSRLSALAWLADVADHLRIGAAATRQPLPLLGAATVSLFMWISELGMFVSLGHAVGLTAPLGGYMVLQGLGNLGLAIPAAPAALGTFDIVALVAARQLDVHTSAATSYVLITHAYLVIPSALIGAAALPFALPPTLVTHRSSAPNDNPQLPLPEPPPSE